MNTPLMADELREKIIANPDVLLEDHDVMRALVGAKDERMGANIVDLRGIAMERLEARFDRLEDTHRSVIAAAYDNLAGTNQVHRAILRMMDAATFDQFLTDLSGDVADILRVDAIRLVLESSDPDALSNAGATVAVMPENYVEGYITLGRNMPARQVTLREFHKVGGSLYGDRSAYIKSEACLKIDLGPDRMPAMLVMGSEDPQLFTPQQGTDLLTFFAGVFERVVRRWLA
ncbi:MAG: DUF484 family protein [Yoonia sp.]|jgi:uncharacterized protein|uniref:DUF484 family protein n=1 Tax=Yoonia sp. TaxID=2212373 RepID=UPI00273E6936|nr:DUF484 family protein [Yoonia sp.]MDP5085851.1 DUF484 family protein [Yoonia sp.]MDP5361066.1 DUF484 family protein [Paracoccaceae bacterium]